MNPFSLSTRSLVGLLALVLMTPGTMARADVIANWQFPVGFPNGTGNIPTGTSYLPPNQTTVGTQTGTFPIGGPAYPAGTPTIGLLAGNTSAILSIYHSNSATQYTSPAGNGSPYSFSAQTWSLNDYWQAVLPTTGYSGISLSWDQGRSSTGPATFSLRMSTNGTTFTDVISSYSPLLTSSTSGTMSSGTYNSLWTFDTGTFAGASTVLAAAANQTSVWFRLVATSTAAAAGTTRLDNFQVIGVPEPASLGLATAGLVAGGVIWARRRFRRRRADSAL